MEVLVCLFVGQLRSHNWTDGFEFQYFTPFQDGTPHSDTCETICLLLYLFNPYDKESGTSDLQSEVQSLGKF